MCEAIDDSSRGTTDAPLNEADERARELLAGLGF